VAGSGRRAIGSRTVFRKKSRMLHQRPDGLFAGRRIRCCWRTCCPRRKPDHEAAYARSVLLEELDAALEELPERAARRFCRVMRLKARSY